MVLNGTQCEVGTVVAHGNHVRGLDSVARQDALVLILGTFSGKESLAIREYHADKLNAFWDVIEQAFGADIALTYKQRKELLITNQIALWDVLRSAHRTGSSDSTIVGAEANYFQAHSQIQAVFFNGKIAEKLHHKLVAPHLSLPSLPSLRPPLPSTSRNNTHMTREGRMSTWRQALWD